MSDVKWIKLSTGLPSNRKLKQIRKLPNGDTIALMWVFLLCLAGELNEHGMIYFTPEIPYTDEMLADEFDMDIKTIRLGLVTFQKFGMIEIVDDVLCLSAWEKWQSTDRLSEIREYNRLAKQKSRAKQKLLQQKDDVNDKSMTSQRCHDTEEDKEKEDREDKDIYRYIVRFLNENAGTGFKSSSKKTQSLIRARLNEGFTVEDFKTVIDHKCREWLSDPKMSRYLRPETLFGTKFEGYLNEKRSVTKNGQATGNSIPAQRFGNYI